MTTAGEHRKTARVLLINDESEIFLLLTHFDPEVGLPPRWLTPGGAIEDGESTKQAALRELFEETGLRVSPEILGDPIFELSGKWVWADGNFHTFTDTIYELKTSNFDLDQSNWTADERRDVLEFRWWKPQELKSNPFQVSPPNLLELLERR